MAGDRTRTLYRFDVRTPEEFASGHIKGFRSAPGGQLVQETDHNAAVRGARIVLADDLGPRADMSASWLAPMGWDVLVLDGGFDGPLETGDWRPTRSALPDARTIAPRDAAAELAANRASLIDLSPSPAHRKAHPAGARFAIRARLAEALHALSKDQALILTARDEALARLAANDLARIGGTPSVRVLEGGLAAWIAAELPTEAGFENALSAPDDVYSRPYEGADHAAAAKQAYLDWEYGLVDQLARDATHGFFVI
jgi:rhodanese-related sulfurtransferase